MLGEATDKSVLEEVIVYARFIDTVEGKIKTKFLAIAPLTGHPDASNIFRALKKLFSDYGLDLPTSQLVCQTSDGASTLLSTKNGVAGKAKAEFNPKLFVQHCFNHRLVLASKDTQHNIPEHVEDTIKAVLNHFKYSAVSQSQLKSILELKGKKYVKLVTYHKIRWLSLRDCVTRLVSLRPTLTEYFEQEANDRANRAVIRRNCNELYERLLDPTFLLYLFFLHAYLPIVHEVNVQCQRRNGLIFESYSKILTLIRTLMEGVALDITLHLDELTLDNNLREVSPDTYGDDGELKFMGDDFNMYWKQVQDNGDLTVSEQTCVL
jgi:hypothetical protein